MSNTLQTYGMARVFGAKDHQIAAYAAVDAARNLQEIQETIRLQGAMQMHYYEKQVEAQREHVQVQGEANLIARASLQSQCSHNAWMETFFFLKESSEPTRLIRFASMISDAQISDIVKVIREECFQNFNHPKPIRPKRTPTNNSLEFYREMVEVMEADKDIDLLTPSRMRNFFLNRFSDCIIYSRSRGDELNISRSRGEQECFKLKMEIAEIELIESKNDEEFNSRQKKYFIQYEEWKSIVKSHLNSLKTPTLVEKCMVEFRRLVGEFQQLFPDSCRVSLDNIKKSDIVGFVNQIETTLMESL